MDVCAYLLTCLRGAEDSNDRYSGSRVLLWVAINSREIWVEFKRHGLIVVHAVKSDAKGIHEQACMGQLGEQSDPDGIMLNSTQYCC